MEGQKESGEKIIGVRSRNERKYHLGRKGKKTHLTDGLTEPFHLAQEWEYLQPRRPAASRHLPQGRKKSGGILPPRFRRRFDHVLRELLCLLLNMTACVHCPHPTPTLTQPHRHFSSVRTDVRSHEQCNQCSKPITPPLEACDQKKIWDRLLKF